jgi:hypothetical protein
MSQAEMKRQGFIKNKAMARLVMVSVDKVNWTPHIDVISPTFEGDDGDDVWQVRSQHHHGVNYKICTAFIEYTSCTCKWALQGNFCKHQIVVLLTCINPTTSNIIGYCGTYYGTHRGSLKCMFADLGYLQLDDGVSNEEDCNQDLVDEVGIVDIGGLRPWIRIIVLKMVDVSEGSSASMDQALVHLNEIMADITTECTMGASVNLCDHATSLFQGVGSNIHHLGLAQINESMHPRMLFH